MSTPIPRTDFQTLVRAIFQNLKINHHIFYVERSSGRQWVPRHFQQIQQWLSNAILPAFPKDTITSNLNQNSSEWCSNSLKILENHYLNTKTNLHHEIRQAPKQGGNTAWTVALRWAKRRFPYLRAEVLEQTKRELIALSVLEEPTNTTPPIQTTPKRRTPQFQLIPNKRQRQNTSSPPTTQTDYQEQDQPYTNTQETQNPTESNNVNSDPPTPQQEKNYPQRTHNEKTNTKMIPGSYPEITQLQHNHYADIPNPDPREHQTIPLETPGPSNALELLQELRSFEKDQPLCTRHDHRGNKTQNWNLTPKRPIIIMGDSNLSRFPPIQDDRIQVDCYPGADLSQAIYLLRNKTPTTTETQIVILSFGLNNKHQTQITNLRKDVLRLLSTAKTTFPFAKILIPLINFSTELEPGICKNIRNLNQIIRNTNKFIPRIPYNTFQTERDRIHWTPETASTICTHWLSFLEFPSLKHYHQT